MILALAGEKPDLQQPQVIVLYIEGEFIGLYDHLYLY